MYCLDPRCVPSDRKTIRQRIVEENKIAYDWIMRSYIIDVTLFLHPHDNRSIASALKDVIIDIFKITIYFVYVKI